MKPKKIILVLFAVLLLVQMASANYVDFSVRPVSGNTVKAGSSIQYILEAELLNTFYSNSITETFSVKKSEALSKWNYEIEPASFVLSEIGQKKSSVVTFHAPRTAIPGPLRIDLYGQSDMLLGTALVPIEVDVNIINPEVEEIPEFPTIAIPVLLVFGLVSRKRKQK